MNDCLPRRAADGQQDARDSAAEVFERAFADAAELVELGPAARRLLAHAAALFARQGAAATSVRDITRACGLTPGALYRHFASKDDLLYALVEHGHDRMQSRLTTALATAGEDPVERTAAFVRAYTLGHLEQPQLAQLVRREYLHLSSERYGATVVRRRRVRDELAQLLRTGAAKRRFDLIGGPRAATSVALMILDLCSRTSEWFDPARSAPATQLADRYVEAALRIAGATNRSPSPLPR